MLTTKVSTRNMLIRALVALALVAIAFGHQNLRLPASTGNSISTAELAAYTLPDGSTPVICFGTGGPGNSDGKGAAGTGCDACRLTAAVALPVPPCDMTPERLAIKRATPALPEQLVAQRAFPPSAPPTAPPLT